MGLAVAVAGGAFGVHVGDSDVSFVVMLGLAALLNAAAIFAIARALRRG